MKAKDNQSQGCTKFTNKVICSAITLKGKQNITFKDKQNIDVLRNLQKPLEQITEVIESSVEQLNEQEFRLTQNLNLEFNSQSTEKKEEDEFVKLRTKMTEIEYIASMQIKLLREQLQQKQDAYRKLQQILNQRNICKIDASTNTFSDEFVHEQIHALKQALIRHVRINKYLTERIQQNDQLGVDELISKVQI